MAALEIGRIVKPHGIRGEVVVDLVTNRPERLAAGERFDELLVVSSRPHQGRWIVQFEGFFDRSGAELLRGRVLSAEPLDEPDELWVHELVGARVVDITGRERGTVVAVEANPASDLLVLEGGGLVPLRFVTEKADGVVTIDPPAGLLDDDDA